MMSAKKNIIDLSFERANILFRRYKDKIRIVGDEYEYCVIDRFEHKFDDFVVNYVPIGSVNAILLQQDKALILAGINFAKERFLIEDITNWLDVYKVVYHSKENDRGVCENCSEIIEGVLFYGNTLLLCKKGNDKLYYNKDEFEEITDSLVCRDSKVNYNKAIPLELDKTENESTDVLHRSIMINGQPVKSMPRIFFDPSKDLVISNGMILNADSIGEFFDTVGFFHNDEELPFAFISDNTPIINIDIEITDTGKICIIEFDYEITQEDLIE